MNVGRSSSLLGPLKNLLALSRGFQTFGAGEGNRTLVVSLEGFCSTIELHPHPVSSRPISLLRFGALARASRARPLLGTAARKIWWTGLDSNQRTLARADLQSAAFNHSATCPKGFTRKRQPHGEATPFCQSVCRALRRVRSAIRQALRALASTYWRDHLGPCSQWPCLSKGCGPREGLGTRRRF
jgi:hypothetical protein